MSDGVSTYNGSILPTNIANGGAVPAAGSGGGSDIASLLSMYSGQNAELLKSAQAAATPMLGGETPGVPLQNQAQNKQAPFINPDNRPVVGRKNAHRQGIANAITGAMNAVSGFETAIENQKSKKIADGTHQLLTLQAQIDQAKQIPKDSPAYAQAQVVIERNTSRQNQLLADNTLRKGIAKGFQIDFTDPKANASAEHKGVQQGQEAATQSLAQQFQQAQPQALVPNQAAIAKYQAQLQEQKLNQETMKAMIPLIRTQMTVQGNLDKTALQQNRMDARAYVQAQNSWDRLQAQIQGRQDLARTQFGYKLLEQSNQAGLNISEFRAKLETKDADPIEQNKAYEKFKTDSVKTISDLTKTIGSLETQKNSMVKADPSVIKSLDEQINTAKETLKTYKQTVDGTTAYYQKLIGGKEEPSASTDDTTGAAGTGISSAASYNPDTDEEPDESDQN